MLERPNLWRQRCGARARIDAGWSGAHAKAQVVAVDGTRERELTPAVDIWSTGMLLYELITLDTPWHATGPVDRFKLPEIVATGVRPAVPVHIDAPLMRPFLDLFQQCTERDPEQRPTAKHLRKRLLRLHEMFSDH